MSDLRLARPGRLVPAVGAATALLVLVALALAEAGGVGFLFLAREPATAVRGAGTCAGVACSYAGLLSNVGVLAAWGAAAVAATCAALARGTGRAWVLPAALAGATAALALDDAFLLHDEALTELVPEPAVLVAYAGLGTGWVVAFRRPLSRTSWPLLAGAALLLLGSSAVDVLAPGHNVLEDGLLKLPGLLLWSAYVAGTCLLVARRVGA